MAQGTNGNSPSGRYRFDFGSHMTECDANYARLMRLLPDLDDRDRWALSLVPASTASVDAAPVELEVIERCPYTTTLRCSQPILGDLPYVQPSMVVRLYHDAQTAEVTEYQNEGRFAANYPYPNAGMRLPDEKAQLNRLLGDLLLLCSGVEPTLVAPSG